MALSKKQFIAIAAQIKSDAEDIASRPDLTVHQKSDRMVQLQTTASGLTLVLQADDPLFDRARFLRACGF